MNFKPINGDHAISEVAFKLAFDRNLSVVELGGLFKALQGIQGSDDPDFENSFNEFRQELPWVQAEDLDGPALRIGRMRPDGSTSWSVDVGATDRNQLLVTCNAYSRWDRVSAKAIGYLKTVLATMLAASKKPLIARMVSLVVTDQFLYEPINEDRAKVDFSELLKSHDLLAEISFSGSKAFHSHVGHFYIQGPNEWVERLNVQPIGQLAGSPLSVLQIVHDMEARGLNEDVSTNVEAYSMDKLGPLLAAMHQRNKRLMSEILTNSAKSMISLNMVEEGS